MPNKIKLTRGDITKLKVDVIVNAANSSLLGGGGVDGAIHRAGGKAILEECMAIRSRQGGCKTGDAVITTGGKLPARYVIHTVGPVYNGGKGGVSELLANCYRNSLKLAVNHDVKTIAFPNISTGIYGYPKQPAAEIAVATIREFLRSNDSVEEVVFVCFDDENLGIYEQLLNSK
ncbi:MAG: O-acetyl-ADP-ribose deacetylase [Mucilaginibacter sp.]|uniref:O-acetyl-ADP-ribose deacetylase n=1 Tax=Mucilaginibacter sp. TaxID=1882438 RepID=UPI0032630BA3